MNKKEFLEQVHQMMQDNQLTCEYCCYGNKRPVCIECTMHNINQSEDDYCSDFEDKRLKWEADE